MDKRALDELIEHHYDNLPTKLQQAARYLMHNPEAVALKSMREVAADAGLPASTMNRLARQLGFEGYQPLRDIYKAWLSEGSGVFSQRANALQSRGHADRAEALVHEIVHADIGNLDRLRDGDAIDALKTARDEILRARRVYVVGLRSLFPAAFYFHYACNMFMQNTSLLTGVAGVLADDLRHAREGDVLVIFSYDPYAREAVMAAEFARIKGLRIVAITDSVLSPVAKRGTAVIVATNATPSFFPSVVPAMAIAQTLVALLIASGGKTRLKEIENSEAQLRKFAVYLDGKH